MNGDFYSKIRTFVATAKGARKKVASYLIRHPEETAFMTIEGLAASCGVSAGMVSRTVREMGFDGFADMQNQIREVVRKNITPYARLKRASGGETSLRRTVRWEIKNLASILRLNSEEAIRNAASMLIKGKTVHVLGLRSSYSLAFTLANGLRQIRRRVYQMDLGTGNLSEQIKALSPDDVLVIISFPRYLRESLLMVQEGKLAGCRILGITDGFSSPVTLQADIALLAPFDSGSFFNSAIPAYGIVNTLLAECAQMMGEESVEELARLATIQERWKLLISSEDSWRPNLDDKE